MGLAAARREAVTRYLYPLARSLYRATGYLCRFLAIIAGQIRTGTVGPWRPTPAAATGNALAGFVDHTVSVVLREACKRPADTESGRGRQ
jgi:hypothetical protein